VWTAVFAFGAVALVRWDARTVATGLGVASVVALVLTLGPLRTRGRFLDDPDLAAAPPVAVVSAPEPVRDDAPAPTTSTPASPPKEV
jgi:UDP-GlcNAc:undecaprenyl-phosphate/decaprenyl-phosphate GlcNAc-1-phosphate transferase